MRRSKMQAAVIGSQRYLLLSVRSLVNADHDKRQLIHVNAKIRKAFSFLNTLRLNVAETMLHARITLSRTSFFHNLREDGR